MKSFVNRLCLAFILSQLALTGLAVPVRVPHAATHVNPHAPPKSGSAHSTSVKEPTVHAPHVPSKVQGAIKAVDAASQTPMNDISGKIQGADGVITIADNSASIKAEAAALEAQNAAHSTPAKHILTQPQINPTDPAITKQFPLLEDFKYPVKRRGDNRAKFEEDTQSAPTLQRLEGGASLSLKDPKTAQNSWINRGAKPVALRFTDKFLMEHYINQERYCGSFKRKGPSQEFGYGIDKFGIAKNVNKIFHFDMSEQLRVFATLENVKGDANGLKVKIVGVGYHIGGNTVSYSPFSRID